MSNYMLGIWGLVLLVVLILMGMRIGLAMAVVGFFGGWYMRGFPTALGYVVNTPFATCNSESLSVIPLFTLMGVICAYAGISQDLYAACYKFVGDKKGGLAIATEIACGFFSAICGSATAMTASLGKICLTEMDKYKYKRTLTCGSIAAGGTQGILIPPSVGLMLYAINAGVGVGKMFIAGILPGIILCVCYSLVVVAVCAIDPEAGPRGPSYTLKEKLAATPTVLPVLCIFFVVLGGILFGWFSATEGAAVGTFASFILMTLRGKLNLQNVVGALKDTISTTAMIFMIMIGANIFGNFLSATGFTQAISTICVNAQVDRFWILFSCLMIYVIIGLFVDSLPLIVLLTPIFVPVIDILGYDRIWFGILMAMVMQLGLITPPVGMCVFVIGGIAKDTPLPEIFKGVAPFIVGLVVALVIVMLFPGLATWLPSIMRYGM